MNRFEFEAFDLREKQRAKAREIAARTKPRFVEAAPTRVTRDTAFKAEMTKAAAKQADRVTACLEGEQRRLKRTWKGGCECSKSQ